MGFHCDGRINEPMDLTIEEIILKIKGLNQLITDICISV